jgi:hypothetical protein
MPLAANERRSSRFPSLTGYCDLRGKRYTPGPGSGVAGAIRRKAARLSGRLSKFYSTHKFIPFQLRLHAELKHQYIHRSRRIEPEPGAFCLFSESMLQA